MLKLFTNRLIGRKPVISLLFNQQLGIKFRTSTFLFNQRQAATFGLRTFADSSVASEEGDGDRGRKEADNISEEKGSRNQQERWDYMVKQLIVYREEHGDTLVSCEYEANPRLGTWGKKKVIDLAFLFCTRLDDEKSSYKNSIRT